MRRRQKPPRVRVEIVSEHTAEVRGDGVHRVLERAKIPCLYNHRPISGGQPCWTIPRQFARDVEAMAEHLGGSAEVDGQVSLWTSA